MKKALMLLTAAAFAVGAGTATAADKAGDTGRLMWRDTMPSVGLAVDRRIRRPATRNRSAAPWPAATARATASSMPWPDAISTPSTGSLRPATASAMAWACGKASPRITATLASGLPTSRPNETGISPPSRSASARVVALGCQPAPPSTSQAAIPARRASRTTRAAAGTPATSRSASCPAVKTMSAEVEITDLPCCGCVAPAPARVIRCKLCADPVYPSAGFI